MNFHQNAQSPQQALHLELTSVTRRLAARAPGNDGLVGQDSPSPQDSLKLELADVDRRIGNLKAILAEKLEKRSRILMVLETEGPRTEARLKFIDFDARRDPKTPFWCIMCQKDLKPDQAHKLVRLILTDHGAWPHAMHPDDVASFDAGELTIPENAHDHGAVRIGMDCAKKLGLAWTLAP